MGIGKILDRIDRRFCRLGIFRAATWDTVCRRGITKLYAGALSRDLPQFRTHLGITPFEASTRNINHDLCRPLPIANSSIDIFQSEDVFEHIPYSVLPLIIEEVFRVLKPSGLFRLSVPDYRCPVMLDRSVKNSDGDPIFDPGGGGRFIDGKVVEGGHLWFPTYETVKALLDQSSFAMSGTSRFLHNIDASGDSVLNPIDYTFGHIQRTPDHDDRARSPRQAMSIVVDAIKNQ